MKQLISIPKLLINMLSFNGYMDNIKLIISKKEIHCDYALFFECKTGSITSFFSF